MRNSLGQALCARFLVKSVKIRLVHIIGTCPRMAKDGKAKVLSDAEYSNLLEQIRKHRHPEKNNLIMQISFKLGLRVQEISLLQIKHVAELGSQYSGGFE